MAEGSGLERTPSTSTATAEAGIATGGTTSGVDSGDDDEPATTTAAAPRVTSAVAPLLIEDIEGESVPASYALALEALQAARRRPEPLTKYDVIALFVYVIMLEQGFVPVACAAEFSAAADFAFDRTRVHALCRRLPAAWTTSPARYECTFVLGDFALQQCRLLCTVCTDDLLVNCKVHGLADRNYSMLVDPSQYVIDSRMALTKRFQHVRHFATRFKNVIAVPAKWDVLEVNDVQTPRLQDLPAELKIELEKLVKDEFFNDL